MVRPYHFSTVEWPSGRDPKDWVRDVKRMKAKGWLADPGPEPQDKRRAECFARCKRPRCRRAKRCKFIMPLALRENRHTIWQNWQYKVSNGTSDPVFRNASKLCQAPAPPDRNGTPR